MSNRCYALVRGSAVRITGLDKNGAIPHPIQFALSKTVAKVTINESTESASNERIDSDGEDDKVMLRFTRPEQVTLYTVDAEFLRVDPGVLGLISGVPLVYNDSGDVVGFDSDTRLTAVSFALEVWSKLTGQACAPGAQEWGYTVLPYLRGGYLSGFKFENGLVSFNLRKAKARKVPRWGVGPYDLEGPHERLIEVVSRNTLFRQMLTTAVPPAQADGIQTTSDVIDGGTATVTTSDIVDGETVNTSVWIVEGGRAS